MSDDSKAAVPREHTEHEGAQTGSPSGGDLGGSRGAGARLAGKLRAIQFQDWILLPLVVLLFIVGAVASPSFLTQSNIINNIFHNSAVLGVVVVAESLILISGEFDLSVESTVALAPMLGVWMILPASAGGLGLGFSPYLAILIMLVVGAVIGTINGFFVIKLRLNSFIVTFALLLLLRGITLGITSGQSLSGLPKEIIYLGSATWLGLPVAVWVFVLLFIVADVFLKMHPKGRAIYALGGNPEAARATGINVNRLGWSVYVVAGVLAAMGGLMLTGRIASVTVDQGRNLILSVLAVAVLGGVSLDGGRGRMLNVLVATILLATITNLLQLLQMPAFWVDATYGGIIVVTLALQGAARARRQVVKVDYQRKCIARTGEAPPS